MLYAVDGSADLQCFLQRAPAMQMGSSAWVERGCSEQHDAGKRMQQIGEVALHQLLDKHPACNKHYWDIY